MNILFLGTTGVHHTLVAAHEYLGTLQNNDCRSIQYFADNEREESGYPNFIGFDSIGNKVYTLGGGSDIPMVKKAIEQLVDILGYSEKELLVKPISINNDKLILVLHKLAQIPFLKSLSLYLINYLLQQEIPSIRNHVQEMKNNRGH